uniref:Coiled-coil domain containing 17 n=1 Tax=Terrapene triunguis TaxID=2587831 RepID=A0A674I0V6_9SAUR
MEMAFEVPSSPASGDGGTSGAPMATHKMPHLCLNAVSFAFAGLGRGILYLLRLGMGLGLHSGSQSMCHPWAKRGSLSAGCQEPDSVLLPLRALHLAYLQGGGSDPAVLAQMYDLQVEATVLERACASPLLSGSLPPGALDKELAEQQRAHAMEMAQLHAEVGMLRREAERVQPRRAGRRSPPMLPPPVAPPLPPPPPLPLAEGSPHLSLCLLSLPYRAGFVIFYDFLLGLDPTFFQVCLVAGLYRNGQEMGKPTPLPVAYCQMGQSPPYVVDGQRGNSAVLSAKQPVPRVRPSTSIALVMEVQASGGFDAYGQEIQRLASRGWAKINLFDQLHQLISGRWKILVRLLPMQPGLTTEQLNGIPQAGKTELYLRVVNARDADMQSMAEIDPGNAAMYQYPPTVSRSPRAFDACTAPRLA